ncbi:uncharacterized protein LOC127856224 [Dreissena polymorpha]|uniref:Uncharacterized protein n=1 Tax=Dreissena polymorpha TaxID=45954 RepID=A0A9D4HC31_DREPO|nr:uncharacterized protein LOC127856224 [Dreissena polymorpha]KAH3714797.1 hypothetical protein DPMN_057498 [Dreissena polymorpha]
MKMVSSKQPEQAVAQSTYRESYKGVMPLLPVIRYKTHPGLCDQENQLHRNNARIDVSIPPTSMFQTTRVQHSQATSNRLSARSGFEIRKDQPTCKSHCPQKVFDTKFGPMDMETIEQLYNKTRYSTCAQIAAREVSVPMFKLDPPTTTREKAPDMVRPRGQRYESRPEEWQDAVLWDRLQSRPETNARPRSGSRQRLLHIRKNKEEIPLEVLDKIRDHVRTDNLASVFVKKCPGYLGYTPMCPPETRLDDRKSPPEMTSLMRASYRRFPDNIYEREKYARQGPFSKTVTLTFPFNPFNKKGQDRFDVDRESLYTNINMKEIKILSNL